MVFSLVVVCPLVWVRWVASLPHLLFIDRSFLTKIESFSHPFLALSSLSFCFWIALRAYPRIVVVLSQCPMHVYPENAWELFVLLFLCNFTVIICFVILEAYVWISSASAVEDQCLVLSFGGLAVWLSSLIVLSL